MADDPTLKLLAEIELQAEKVNEQAMAKVELDRRRNQSREAVRALQKTKDEQVWMGFGSFFCQLPRADAVRMANKDLNQANDDYDKAESQLKKDVTRLEEMRGSSLPRGFGLKAVDKKELYG